MKPIYRATTVLFLVAFCVRGFAETSPSQNMFCAQSPSPSVVLQTLQAHFNTHCEQSANSTASDCDAFEQTIQAWQKHYHLAPAPINAVVEPVVTAPIVAPPGMPLANSDMAFGVGGIAGLCPSDAGTDYRYGIGGSCTITRGGAICVQTISKDLEACKSLCKTSCPTGPIVMPLAPLF